MESLTLDKGHLFRKDGIAYAVTEQSAVPVEQTDYTAQPTYYRKLKCATCGYGPLRATTKVIERQGVPLCPRCAPSVAVSCKCGHVLLVKGMMNLPACGTCTEFYTLDTNVAYRLAADGVTNKPTKGE